MNTERCKFYAPDGNEDKIKAAEFLNSVLESLSDEEYQEMIGSCLQELQREIDEALIAKLWSNSGAKV